MSNLKSEASEVQVVNFWFLTRLLAIGGRAGYKLAINISAAT
jgi:hypothetical protein